MFIIDWVFDKMGYTKKVDWSAVFATYEVTDKPAKITAKKAPAKKTVGKKAAPKKRRLG